MSATMTPDECFNEMAKVLGFPKPDETGYIAILEKVKELQEKNDDLENKVLHLESEKDDMESEVLDAQDSYALQKQTEQVYYHGEPLKCIEDGTPITISDVFPNKFIKELQKENMELSKKSNAKSDIIRNMFDFITEYPEEVQEGFTFKRGWGHKYIDEWNKIVTEEIQEAIKDINEDDEHYQIRTNGYQFDFHYPESESDDDEVE